MTKDVSPAPLRKRVNQLVGSKAAALQWQLLDEASSKQSDARASLARLRRADVTEPGSDPRLWSLLFGENDTLSSYDSDEPTDAERAAYAALSLFATRAQSATKPVHVAGRRLGSSVRSLADVVNADSPETGTVAKRFQAAALTHSFDQRVHHLRGLVQLMRAHDVALDFGSLGEDLFLTLSRGREGQHIVQRRWGRDFHHVPKPKTNVENGSDNVR